MTGILGAIIGGAIATIPWVLAYVYGNMMLSILAALIAAGEFYGYKICKGKIDKKLPIIIMVIAIIIVMITTLVIIPGLLIQKQGLPVSVTNIQKLYTNSEFSTAIAQDFIISVIFTILGASIITANIKKQLENNDGKEVKLDFNNNNEQLTKLKNDAIELIKPIFKKYNATTSEKAMMKEEVLAELTENKGAKIQFNYLKQLGIIKKYKGKYYYSEIDEDKQIDNKSKTKTKINLIVLAVLAILVIAIGIFSDISENSGKSEYKDSNIKFEIDGDWTKINSQYIEFYKYINTFPVADSQTNTTEQDYSSYPAVIAIVYNEVDPETIKSIEDVKALLDTTFEKAEEKPDTLEMNVSKTTNNYDMLKVKLLFNTEPEEVLYYYYILDGEKLACITSYSYNLADDEELERVSDELSNSFECLSEKISN